MKVEEEFRNEKIVAFGRICFGSGSGSKCGFSQPCAFATSDFAKIAGRRPAGSKVAKGSLYVLAKSHGQAERGVAWLRTVIQLGLFTFLLCSKLFSFS